jgi:hypothetical protein
MGGKRNLEFRERQLDSMIERLDRVQAMKTPFLIGGILIPGGAVLGLNPLGFFVTITGVICFARGIGYAMEAKRLGRSIATAEDRLDEIELDSDQSGPAR